MMTIKKAKPYLRLSGEKDECQSIEFWKEYNIMQLFGKSSKMINFISGNFNMTGNPKKMNCFDQGVDKYKNLLSR